MIKYAVLFATLAFASLAHAADELPSYILHHSPQGHWIECDESTDCARLPGTRGVWFELGLAQKLVLDHQALPEAQAALAEAEQKATAISVRVGLCEQREKLALGEAQAASASVDDALAQRDDAQAETRRVKAAAGAWYNARLLWFSLGAIAVAAAGGGAYAIFH